MRVTILGSGTAVPEPGRFPAGVLVEAAGTTLVVDLGPGVLRRLAEAGVGPEALDAVLLTHFHTDHTADLAALLFALRNPRYAGRQPLYLLAAPGLRDLLAALRTAWPWCEPRGYDLRVRELAPRERVRLGSVAIAAVPVLHTTASLAYRLEGPEGEVAAISGDSDACPGLAEAARGADLFVCEAAFPAALRQEGHLTPRLAAEAAAAAGAHTLCLTHFYPECAGHDLAAEAAAAFPGAVVLAEDLLQFELGPPFRVRWGPRRA